MLKGLQSTKFYRVMHNSAKRGIAIACRPSVYPGTAQCFQVPPIIPGTGKATDFKFGRYIRRAHPNKGPLKISEKMERGRIQGAGTAHFLQYPIISETGKSTNFKFCMHIHKIDLTKRPLKRSGKVAVVVLRESRKFSGHPYTGRIAVARLSLR